MGAEIPNATTFIQKLEKCQILWESQYKSQGRVGNNLKEPRICHAKSGQLLKSSIPLLAEAFNHCLWFKDNNPIMHLANYEMLYMDKGKSFLIPTETSQCPEIWDLIKPVLLLQMLQLFITFSRPFSIQHGIHIYNLLWHRSLPAQLHAVRHLLQKNEIYGPFFLIFLTQSHASQKCMFFQVTLPTSASHPQAHTAVDLVNGTGP